MAGTDPEGADDVADATAVDPMSDLLLSLTAAIIAGLAVLWPLVGESGAAPGERPAPPTFALDGRSVSPFTAGSSGLRFTPGRDGERTVPLDRIGEDPDLRDALARRADGTEPLLLLVEPDGLEAAFLFEAVAATHGPARLTQVRLPAGCRPGACGAGRSRAGNNRP